MPIWLDINLRSGVPLYLQLVEQFQRALEIGILRSGDALPTVRQLAGELKVAPNTVVKAYGELERLGLITSRAGAGTTVSAGLDDILQQQSQRRLHEQLRQLAREAAALDIGEHELRDWLETAVQQAYHASEAER